LYHWHNQSVRIPFLTLANGSRFADNAWLNGMTRPAVRIADRLGKAPGRDGAVRGNGWAAMHE
jgi:hypothetical protein